MSNGENKDWVRHKTLEDHQVLLLSGVWRLKDLAQIADQLSQIRFIPKTPLVLDGEKLEEIDTASAMILLNHLRDSGFTLTEVKFLNFANDAQQIIKLCTSCSKEYIERDHHLYGFLARFGRDSLGVLQALSSVLSFVGETSVELVQAVIRPRLVRVKELAVQLELAGFNAIPIVCLVTFLIGVVIAYLTGVQLQKYGANIFIVDSVSLAMCRELSPILVAIVVAGRSGSAFAAQIGAMKLNEEIDALITLGFSPMRILVLPRLLAMMIVMPMLVFIGDVAGIFGGLVIADLQLDITAATFVDRLQIALWPRSVLVGLIKAPVFGFFVAIIGCKLGLEVKDNARSVGENTTATVVRSVVAVILLDAAFAVLYSELGI